MSDLMLLRRRSRSSSAVLRASSFTPSSNLTAVLVSIVDDSSPFLRGREKFMIRRGAGALPDVAHDDGMGCSFCAEEPLDGMSGKLWATSQSCAFLSSSANDPVEDWREVAESLGRKFERSLHVWGSCLYSMGESRRHDPSVAGLSSDTEAAV